MSLNPAGSYMLKLLGKPATPETPDLEEDVLMPVSREEAADEEWLLRLRQAAARLGIDWVRP